MGQEEPRDETDTAPAAGGEEKAPAVEAETPELVEPTETVEPVVEEAEVVEPPSELELVNKRLEQAQARLRTVSKAYTDLQNEMKAFRDRMENRAKFAAERQAFDAVSAFFEPVTNLKRAMAVDDPEALQQGLAMVHKQFDDALVKLGLEPVPSEGAKFNPAHHEALAVTPVADPAQDGMVLMVHQQGYMVNGKVLRAAQVIIGKLEEAAEA